MREIDSPLPVSNSPIYPQRDNERQDAPPSVLPQPFYPDSYYLFAKKNRRTKEWKEDVLRVRESLPKEDIEQ